MHLGRSEELVKVFTEMRELPSSLLCLWVTNYGGLNFHMCYRGQSYSLQWMVVVIKVINECEGVKRYMESQLEGSLILEDGLNLTLDVGCR